jgi:hypothetical protein
MELEGKLIYVLGIVPSLSSVEGKERGRVELAMIWEWYGSGLDLPDTRVGLRKYRKEPSTIPCL